MKMHEVNSEIVAELREKVLERLQELDKDLVHPDDLHRFKTNDMWVWRFYVHCLQKMGLATSVAVDALKWRKEFGVNDLNDEKFPAEYFQVGAIYTHNRDKNGNTMLFMHIREHRKERAPVEDLKKFLVYWVEKVDKAENGNRVTILFDLMGAGLGNSDMDFLFFVFSLFKQYYPCFLADILVLELPWILSALWKIFKSWVPKSAHDKFKFVTRKTVLDYVSPEMLPTQMGGMEIFEYRYEPSKQSELKNGTLKVEGPKKQVHFAPENKDMHEKASKNNGDSVVIGSSIQISPAEELVFSSEPDKESPPVTLQIKNISNRDLMYKVKTTAPNKYRVRPSIGVIQPETTVDIHVNLFPGFPVASLSQDKFLVMVVPIEEANATLPMTEIWKSCSRDEIIEHKIRCCWLPHEEKKESSGDLNKELASLGNKINSLRSGNARLVQDVRRHNHLLWTILALQAVIVMVMFLNFILDGEGSLLQSYCKRY